MRAALSAIAVLLLGAAPVLAQSHDSTAAAPKMIPHEQAPTVHAARLTGSIAIDGRLDEPAWQTATPAGGFLQTDPQEGQPATEPTEFRVLVGDDAIYIGLRMFDRDPKQIRSVLARRDEAVEGDVLEVYLDTFHDHLTAYDFRVTPAGAIRDVAIGADGNGDASWDAVWQAGTSIDSLGWVAEMRIPFSQIGYNSVDDGVWGIQVGRRVHRKAEVSVFSFTPKSERGGVFRYGHLDGLGRLPKSRHLELLPYTSARAEYLHVAPGNPFRDGSDDFAQAGLDLKYGITSSLTLNATINPDFGQVEVDPAVVNLTAFETFYDEKRPFFIERAEMFRFARTRSYNNFQSPLLFHSRRIGRAPQRALGGSAYPFVDAPKQSTILAAAKLTGKTRGGWSVAALDAVTDEETARYVDPTNPLLHDQATVEPKTNYFTGRARRDFKQGNSSVGAILTAVNRDLSDPVLASMLRSQSVIGGVDFSHYWAKRTWEVDGSFSTGQVRGSTGAIAITQRSSARYYQRPDAKSFHFDPTRTSLSGFTGHATVAKTSGQHWLGSVMLQTQSPGFEPNDLGFQTQMDRKGFSTLALYKEDKPGKLFRSYDSFVFTNHQWNYDGDVVYSQLAATAEGTFNNYWYMNLRGENRWRYIDDRLTRGGPVVKLTRGNTVLWNFNSDPRRRITKSLNASVSWNAAGGWGVNYGGGLNARPLTSLQVRFEPSLSRSHARAQYVATVGDPLATSTYGARYVFANLDQTQLSLSTRVNWTMTPRLSFQLYVQPLVASGDYAEFKEFLTPRTFDFGVYGRDQGTIAAVPGGYSIDPDGAGPASAFAIGNPDFNFRSLLGNAVVRWEYRPGSALFFVWQQSRTDVAPIGDFDFSRDADALFSRPPENIYAVKATWWIGG
jgi:hypothetical protein